MLEEDLIKVFRISIEITDAKKEVTITPNTLAHSFRIAYMDSPILNDILQNGYHYLSIYAIDYKMGFFTSAKIYEKIFRKFLKTINNDEKKYKIGSATIPFLCGIADKMDEFENNP
jgi:hypothetical protein